MASSYEPIEDLQEGGSFDALFCHEDDERLLVGWLSASGGAASPQAQGPGL
jgi:hypothetical protein